MPPTTSRLSRRPAHRMRRPHGGTGDGGYSVVEAAITLPAIIMLTLLVVQYALLWHGRHVAESAARDGLEAARAYEAPEGAGQAAARSYLTDVAPNLLTSPDVTVTRTPTTVSVSVTARVLRVIPVGDYSVSETVQGPIERFVSLPAGTGRPAAGRVGAGGGGAVTWL
jgi:Flp pilus assembly protein TadG